MNKFIPDTITRIITCRKGGRLLFAGKTTREPLPAVQIFVCPIHGDKVTVHTGLPRRKWSYLRTLAEGGHATPYSPQYQRFYREEEGAEAYQKRKYRRRHKIKIGKEIVVCPGCKSILRIEPPPPGAMVTMVITDLHCPVCGTKVSTAPTGGYRVIVIKRRDEKYKRPPYYTPL